MLIYSKTPLYQTPSIPEFPLYQTWPMFPDLFILTQITPLNRKPM